MRLPFVIALVGCLVPLGACASGSGAGAGAGGGNGAGGGYGEGSHVHVLDLMTKKPDADPPEVGGKSKPLKGKKLVKAMARTVSNHRPAFQKCIEDASKKRGKAKAKATLMLTVRGDGVVSSAKVAEEALRKKPLGHCLVDASYRMSFPRFEGASMKLKVPLSLIAE